VRPRVVFALLLRATLNILLFRALEQLMKDKGMADPRVIRACVELCDYLNGKVAVALVRVHDVAPIQPRLTPFGVWWQAKR
jgi:hypothetical protein